MHAYANPSTRAPRCMHACERIRALHACQPTRPRELRYAPYCDHACTWERSERITTWMMLNSACMLLQFSPRACTRAHACTCCMHAHVSARSALCSMQCDLQDRGRRRPRRACLRRFRAGDFAACADSDDESAQQVWMEMSRQATRNPKSLTLNRNSMMQADSSATLTEPVVASIYFRRFREPDPKNSVAFACCDPRCPRSRTMRHVTLKA